MAITTVTLRCEQCHEMFTRPAHRLKQGVRYCSRICFYNSQFKFFTAEYFWAAVVKTPTCWLWALGADAYGYGDCRPCNGSRKAHVTSYFLTHGKMPELNVLHRCDVPRCVNPEHLFEGTQQENHADMISKGRHSKGESRYNAIVSADDVRSIRERYARGGITQRALAAEYPPMTRAGISRIIRRKVWKHIK